MSLQLHGISKDMGQLATDANALMAATADVAGEQVGEARRRLALLLEAGKCVDGIGSARATNDDRNESSDRAIAIGAGIATLISSLVASYSNQAERFSLGVGVSVF